MPTPLMGRFKPQGLIDQEAAADVSLAELKAQVSGLEARVTALENQHPATKRPPQPKEDED